jgi:hypothetical protein
MKRTTSSEDPGGVGKGSTIATSALVESFIL